MRDEVAVRIQALHAAVALNGQAQSPSSYLYVARIAEHFYKYLMTGELPR